MSGWAWSFLDSKTMNSQQQMIRAGDIQPGKNPRTYFDPVLQVGLEKSIAAQNLLQPLLVRPFNGGFQLVAGERRLRAFKVVFGEDALIPTLVREMTDEEADAAALGENVDRANMTPVEETEAAARVLSQCLGNRDEAANRLGWSRTMLDKRLALMNATDSVRLALQENKILLGHAELLAACRKESQEGAIEHLLKQENKVSVLDLKTYIETNSMGLSRAIFDKTECASCHHNSDNQASLFAESISNGRCTNKQCFDAKIEEKIKAQAKVLQEEFQVVRIVRPGDNLTVIKLVADGAKGVGVEQATACKVCKDYGAVISTVPDKLGAEFKGMCMNVPCNTTHVAAKLKAETKTAKAAAQAPTTEGGQAAAKQTAAPNDKTTPNAKEAVTKAAASSEPSNRVKEYREEIWRKIFTRAVAKLPVAENRMVLMALCLSNPSVIDRTAFAKAIEPLVQTRSSMRPAELISTFSDLEPAQLGSALNHLAASVNAQSAALDIKDVVGILKFFEIKIENYWKINKTFIDLLTKNEIDAVAEEIGLKPVMGAEYAKLRNGPKEEFIKAVLEVKDFEFHGRIPKLISY